MAIETCLKLPDIPPSLEIQMPAGMSLASIQSAIDKIPNACDPCLNIMSQVGPALAPLKPMFDILDTVIALFNCFKAVPDMIMELSPAPVFECLPELQEKIEQLLKLIPQLSIPYTIISMIDAVIAMLDCMVVSFSGLIDQISKQTKRLEKAKEIGDNDLTAIVECSGEDIEKMQLTTAEAFAGFATLIGVLNILLGLIGGPEIPIDLASRLDGIPLEEIFEPIEDIITVLKTIRDQVPLP